MKRIVFLFICLPLLVHAATPSTSCPSGYIAISAPAITIATSCPSGYIAIGTAESCLAETPAGECIMYVPANTPYSDNYGTYEYSDACPLS